MLEQELKEIWKNSSQTEKIKFETSRLLIELDAKMNRVEKVIRRRDINEISASIFGILLFGYFTYEIPFPLTKIACILSIFWFGYLIFKLGNNKSKKRPIDLALPIREQLDNQKGNMLKEAKLLDTVLYWYVLPPLIANVLFIWGFGDPEKHNWFPLIVEKLASKNMLHLLPVSLKTKMAYFSGILMLNAFIVWINKRAANKTFKPIIKDIEKMQNQFDSDN